MLDYTVEFSMRLRSDIWQSLAMAPVVNLEADRHGHVMVQPIVNIASWKALYGECVLPPEVVSIFDGTLSAPDKD